LSVLDRVLAGCGHAPANAKRTSIFAVPATLAPGSGDSPAALHGPVTAAATLAENLLLEYTQGMSQADTGWGCIDGVTLRAIMQVNSANWDYSKRTPAVARIFASTLLDRILKTMRQSVNGGGATGAAIPGAIGKPGDRLVILVGHDTNIATVAGALGIDWVFDGRVDDTPPGGALLFELWRPRNGGKPFVRLEYIAQTLEQMRNAEALTPANPPAVAPIFVPGCGRQDLSCTWEEFSAAMRASIDPAYVAAQL
jgi:4-phytase/acid phosphatase